MSSEDRATRIAAVEVAATDPLTRAEAWATLMTAAEEVAAHHDAELCAALSVALAAVAAVPEGDYRAMTTAVEGVQAVIAEWDWAEK